MSGAAASNPNMLTDKLVTSLAALLVPGAQARGTALRSLLASRLREVASALDSGAAAMGQAAGDAVPHAAASQLPPSTAAAAGAPAAPGSKRKKPHREFDMSRFPQRTVTLEVFYAGWKYAGFATQGDGPGCAETVEMHLWRALKKTRLVAPEATWAETGYSRCGRTDAGVSAVSQVVALRVRSNLGPVAPCPGRGGAPPPSADVEMAEAADGSAGRAAQPPPPPPPPQQQQQQREKEKEEIDYVTVLNRNLPEDIRVLRWGDVPGPDFSARFSAQWRQYKYLFFNDGLDIDRMREAAQHLVGEHDFRNFCKMDAENVHNFRRKVIWTAIEPEGAGAGGPGVADDAPLWSFNVRGTAFLWHQVRCMMAVLFLVGKGMEPPEVVARLLDLDATPRKPVYPMAPDEPLILFACGYRELDLGGSEAGRRATAGALRELARRHAMRARTLYLAQRHLGGEASAPAPHEEGSGGASYVPLLRRQTEKTYDERRAGLAGRGAPGPPAAAAGGGGEAGRGGGAAGGGSAAEEGA